MTTTTPNMWKPEDTTAGYHCKVCSNPFWQVIYWNVERREVYCGAHCSLKRNEELRPTTGLRELLK